MTHNEIVSMVEFIIDGCSIELYQNEINRTLSFDEKELFKQVEKMILYNIDN